MMNSSSKTSTTLKSSRVSNGSPLVRLFQSKLIASVLFLCLLILLIKLGFWQLNRGYEKQQLEQQLQLRQTMPALTLQQFLNNDKVEELLGRQLSITVNPTSQPLIVLDNQVYQKQVGYLVFQLVSIAPDLPNLLIELGFTPANPDRSRLPQVIPLQQQKHLHGKLYHRLSNPVSHQLYPELSSPIRIQNLNIPQLSEQLQQAILPVVLQPEIVSFDIKQRPLSKPWNPIPMPANKHFGYAMQWFSMAIALLIIGLILLRRHLTPFFSFLSIKRSTDEFSK